jgi:hypothetical protein
MKRIFSLALLLLSAAFCFGQDSLKRMPAVRTALPVKIDGELNDEAWKAAPAFTNFVEQRPAFGQRENEGTKTEVYLLYDDEAIYVGGFCHELSRDSISTELLGRDRIGVNDFVGVIFDTYLDKINGSGYFVTALGEQFDVKYSLGNEDGSWNSVYQTSTKIRSDGWTFEMRIPYSAIRFSKEKVQNWGLHVLRRRSKTGEQFSWSPIDPQKFGLMNQAGVWSGITDIKSPLRLSFSPYFSTYLSNDPAATSNQWDASINGGMDVKYGISKGFTLDMTLIPDFGQVQSDNQVLNLSPFEVRFNENRSFFNEGTELFNKGNFFYSRRIGGVPLHYGDIGSQLAPGEKVVRNPSETKLINATKISGRTPGNLGIGFFNAITNPSYATVESSTKEQHRVETSPLTNYNVIVLDQALKHNSSLTFVNTNVMRSGSDYDANVAAFLFDLYDKKVDWNVWGKAAVSQLFSYEAPGKTTSGLHYNMNLGKFRGPFNFDIHQFAADEKYQQNDLGYFTNNNYLEHGFWTSYKWTKPKGFYNNLYLNLRGNLSHLWKPINPIYSKYQYANINTNINGQLKNLWNFGITADYRAEEQDFYEPRLEGWMAKMPWSWMTGFWLGTNSAKKYSASMEIFRRASPEYKSRFYEMSVNNNYRFNDRLSAGLSSYMEFFNRDLGFAYVNTTFPENIVFGLRNRRTAENVLSLKYNFNIKMGLTFRARHYWSKVEYNRFFTLKRDGYYEDLANPTRNPNINVNLFNIDMVYTWQFAPGSFLNIGWKSASQLVDQLIQQRYYRNLRNTLSNDQANNFSVKVIYFLDYLSLKRGKAKGQKAEGL